MSGRKTRRKSERTARLKALLPKLAKGRYYITDEPFESFREVTQPVLPSDKPEGLWYSYGDHWFQFILGDGETLGVKRYVYKINIDTKFVLRLRGAKAIDGFTEEYGPGGSHVDPNDGAAMLRWLARLNWINWTRLSKNYAGIEIAPYCWARRLTMHTQWYYSWDVASGVVWDKKAVKKVTLVEDLDAD